MTAREITESRDRTDELLRENRERLARIEQRLNRKRRALGLAPISIDQRKPRGPVAA
jgi:hypothetical protein